MLRVMLLFVALMVAPTISHGADCREALFNPTNGVFAHEGGYQNSKYDGGNWSSGKAGVGHMCGGTKYGIPCAYYPKLDIKNLTQAQAATIYERNQCAELHFSEMDGQKVPAKMLDLAVNMGVGTAVKLITKTARKLGAPFPVATTMTPEIIKWYNDYTANDDRRSVFYLVMILEALDRYSDIVESNPKQAQWLLGWIIRLNPYSD